MIDLTIDTARDAAQQVVTACIHGDRSSAVDIAQEYPDQLVLALVLADLVAFVHHKWGRAVGFDQAQIREGWAELMADVEGWRAEEGDNGER